MKAVRSCSFTAKHTRMRTNTDIVGFLLAEKLSAKSHHTPLFLLHFNDRCKSYNCSSFYGTHAQITAIGRFTIRLEFLLSQPK